MKKWAIVLVILLLSAVLFVWANNKWITVTEYSISSPEIPDAFDGARIAQISDLHSATFGVGQSAILEKTADAEPDIIFVTGDIVDSARYDLETALTLMEGLLEIAPVYFATGNQEISKDRVEIHVSALENLNIIVLENEMMEWNRAGQTIYIAGIHDPLIDASMHDPLVGVDFHDPQIAYAERAGQYVQESLKVIPFTDTFTLLLAHRPEYIDEYAETEADVVFSGHAHGGQIRIPGIGGVFAPGQGFFPELTEGTVKLADTELVISRGLGNSSFPLRIFNRPEIVTVTLNRE
ncbi:metallophosphoesterase [Planococcus lenghuensis]|uniref:Phosphoesterase n=1 Tax=Planococcus lenghuensis TaxID=2213202 RepID=A0A1Q2L2Z9_9BACL|nr:metallophosphoesterase [Planococcus lenghuensis]AQQ54447.1 phosphoesterase [Planococcus lenghuensis]